MLADWLTGPGAETVRCASRITNYESRITNRVLRAIYRRRSEEGRKLTVKEEKEA